MTVAIIFILFVELDVDDFFYYNFLIFLLIDEEITRRKQDPFSCVDFRFRAEREASSPSFRTRHFVQVQIRHCQRDY